MDSGTSSVLLDGVPGKTFHFKKGYARRTYGRQSCIRGEGELQHLKTISKQGHELIPRTKPMQISNLECAK
jgi:hypothetical protein